MSELKVNTISEVTGANGVTVDGLSIKDSKLVTANSVIEANMSADSVDSDSYVDGSIDTAHIADLNVTTGKIAADAITGAKIADDAINSEHYTDGSIDTAHLADGQVTIGKLATAVLTGATDIGAAIVDADLFLIDDGAGGTLRKTTAARLKTYIPGAVTALNNATANEIVTVGATTTELDAEANLLFDGNEMTVQGTPVVVGTNSSSVLDLKNTNSSADGRAVGISFSTNSGGSANAHITAVQDANAKGTLNFGGYDGSSTRNIVMSVNAGTGTVTKPLQPVFLVRPSSDQADLATGATDVAWGAEIFDVGANFASNAFTAPVTGKYQFHVSLYLSNIDIDTTLFDVTLIASNRTQRLMAANFAKDFSADGNNFHSMNASTILDMDASDTISVRMNITGGGGVIHLNGGAPSSAFYTAWSGALIC